MHIPIPYHIFRENIPHFGHILPPYALNRNLMGNPIAFFVKDTLLV